MRRLTALVASLLGVPALAQASVITVRSVSDDGAGCTLRDAIRTAQNAPSYAGLGGCDPGSNGADRIVVPAGTFRLTAGQANDDSGAGGDLDIRESVIIEGAGAATTIIDGSGRDRVFHIMGAGVRAEISALTVTQGNASGNDGGGIYVMEGAHLVLDRAVVSHNQANIGGGGVDSFGDLTISNTIIENNRTQNDGGLRCLATCTGRLIDVIVRNNTATGNVGGGLGAAGNLYLERVQVLDNTHTGRDGAGGLSCLQFAGGQNTITVVDSLIARNTTGGDGGGIRVSTIGGFFDGEPRLTVVNTTIVGNRAARGAGLSISLGRASLSSVTIADNQATGEGGGVLRTGGRLEARNTLVARNRAARGEDCRGTISSLGHVVVARGQDCSVEGGAGNTVGMEVALAPALADNGGASQTVALLANSVAVNAGDPAGCGDGARLLTNDQRGPGFPRVVGGRCDVGAFELAGTCGNGTREAGERCDDGNPNDGDCCSSACVPTNSGMTCDDGNAVTTGDACTPQGSCIGTSPTCGDRVIDQAAGETCDDGNRDDTDLCNGMCRDTVCGDGIIQAARAEACDDGLDNSDTMPGACRTNCQRPSCGDGVVDPGESCTAPDGGTFDSGGGGGGGGETDESGCGCGQRRPGSHLVEVAAVLLVVAVLRRRRPTTAG